MIKQDILIPTENACHYIKVNVIWSTTEAMHCFIQMYHRSLQHGAAQRGDLAAWHGTAIRHLSRGTYLPQGTKRKNSE